MKKIFFPLFFSCILYPAACILPLSADEVSTATLVSTAPWVQPLKIYDLKDGPGFCIFGGWSGKPFNTEAAFRSVIWKSDVVYVGETHDQIKDHLAQLEALKALRVVRGVKVAVGFEMLNMTLQPVLDDYVFGKLSEEEFLQKADWAKEWGGDFGLYKPLFDFIIQNKLKALALNVPKKIVSKIARAGLAGLDAEDKKFLPEPVNISKHKKYLEFLKASFDGYGGAPPSAPAPKTGSESLADSAQAGGGNSRMAKLFTWDNYLASMCAWNEGMGSKVAEFVNANPGWSVLVVAGNGHVIYNATIPASVKSRTKKIRQASFYTEDAAKCPAVFPKENKDMANYLWYIRHSTPVKADAK